MDERGVCEATKKKIMVLWMGLNSGDVYSQKVEQTMW